MKQAVKFDPGKWLVIGGAAYQAYQFGRALNVYDPAGWHIYHVNLSGLALGVIVNVIVALAATRIPGVRGRVRTWSAWGAFIVLILLSPSLVAPGLYLLFADLAVANELRIFIALGLAAAPDLAIALGGFITGKSLIPLGESQSEAERVAQGRRAKKSGRTSRSSKPQSEVPCRYAGAGCEKTGTQNAMNAHARHCRFKPTVSMPSESVLKGEK